MSPLSAPIIRWHCWLFRELGSQAGSHGWTIPEGTRSGRLAGTCSWSNLPFPADCEHLAASERVGKAERWEGLAGGSGLPWTLLQSVLGQPCYSTNRSWGYFLGCFRVAQRSTGPGSRNWVLIWLPLLRCQPLFQSSMLSRDLHKVTFPSQFQARLPENSVHWQFLLIFYARNTLYN